MIAIAKASDTEREVLFGNAADRAGMRSWKRSERWKRRSMSFMTGSPYHKRCDPERKRHSSDDPSESTGTL